MSQLDFQSGALGEMLSEALRAGPGSPQWRAALEQLRDSGIEHADEYALLITVREHLESGKSYRAVRAGSGFTRSVMTAIDSADQRRGLSLRPSLIAALAAAAIVIVIAAMVIKFWRVPAGSDRPAAAPQVLLNPIAELQFTATSLPKDWFTVGQLPITISGGALRPGASIVDQPMGGGIVWSGAVPAEEPFALVSSLRLRRGGDDLIAQVFVSDSSEFSDRSATAPHELVWSLQGREAQLVLPGGQIQVQSQLPANLRGPLIVSVRIDGPHATIDVDGKRFFSGPHDLKQEPRRLGVRFLRTRPGDDESIQFESLRLNMKQP